MSLFITPHDRFGRDRILYTSYVNRSGSEQAKIEQERCKPITGNASGTNVDLIHLLIRCLGAMNLAAMSKDYSGSIIGFSLTQNLHQVNTVRVISSKTKTAGNNTITSL
jgi:hypothetical protein